VGDANANCPLNFQKYSLEFTKTPFQAKNSFFAAPVPDSSTGGAHYSHAFCIRLCVPLRIPARFTPATYTVSQKKIVQISFCQNFVKFPPILIIFGTKMAKRLQLCEVYSFFISTNLHHHTTVLNADVPNCYTMLKVVRIRFLTIASSIQ